MRTKKFVAFATTLLLVALAVNVAVAAADQHSGIWKMNPAKSKYSPGPAAKAVNLKSNIFGRGILAPFLGKELFPPIDAGQFTILLRAPSGTRIELSEALSAQIESTVRQLIPANELNTIVSNSGVLYDWPAAYTPNAGPMDTFLNVQLTEDHRVSAQEYVRRLREMLPARFPGISFAFDTGGLLSAALNFGLPSRLTFR